MNLRTELNRLRSEMEARKLQYPAGFWSWVPCPPGSNLGYYECKGEYSMTVPRGGKGVKIEYATVDGLHLTEDRADRDPVYPSADDWKYFAKHAPAPLIEPYNMTRKELAKALPILWRAKIDKKASSESILAELMPDFKLASKADRSAAIEALDKRRGIFTRRPLRKKKAKVAVKVIEPEQVELPTAVEMVQAVKEKLAKPVDLKAEMLDRRYGVTAAKKQAAKNERIAARQAGMSEVEKAFSSDRGWTGWP